MEHWWNTDRRKLKYSRKTCPNATLSTINSTHTGLGLNPSLHCEKLPTTRKMAELIYTINFYYLFLKQET
jgi:hypothetical protein